MRPNASAECSGKTFPRSKYPAMARPPTLTRNARALRQRPKTKCPRPGTAQASMATPSPAKLKRARRDRALVGTVTGIAEASEAACSTGAIISGTGVSFKSLGQQRNNFFLDRAGHARFFLVHIHINFRSNAKFRHVDSGFHGKASVRNNFAIVACFQAVHIRAVAVKVLADAMPSAMHEEFSITRF